MSVKPASDLPARTRPVDWSLGRGGTRVPATAASSCMNQILCVFVCVGRRGGPVLMHGYGGKAFEERRTCRLAVG